MMSPLRSCACRRIAQFPHPAIRTIRSLAALILVPGRVADHGVEAADWARHPASGAKRQGRRLPSAESFSRSATSLVGAPHFGEGGPEGALPDRVCGFIAVGAMRQQ